MENNGTLFRHLIHTQLIMIEIQNYELFLFTYKQVQIHKNYYFVNFVTDSQEN